MRNEKTMILGIEGCEDCAKLKAHLIDAETANAELGRQVAGLERNLRRAYSTETLLRNELEGRREEEPEAKAIKEVCDYWKRSLNHETAKTPLTGARAKAVRARLRERFTTADLKRAIDGCVRVPYVGANGRKPHGKPRERHDDLSLICRDEETVERFIRYANAEVEPTGVDALLAKVENAKQVNEGQWQARCPARR
jgi:hypothetical protein